MTPDEIRDVQKVLRKAFLLLSPVLLFTVIYCALDPFQVLYPVDNYYKHTHVNPCRDFVTTQVLLDPSKKIPYDSFILGSSRSQAFRCSQWVQHQKDASPYHYDAYGESLYGVWLKVKFLDTQGVRMRHVLWVLDYTLLKQARDGEGGEGYLYANHPRLSGMPWPRFHLIFLQDYFKGLFFLKYLDFRIFHTYRPYMKGVIGSKPVKFDQRYNDLIQNLRDLSEVKPKKYYEETHKNEFFSLKRPLEKWSPPAISQEHREMLNEISRIFARQNTNLIIVVSPLYSQVQLNPRDLSELRQIFKNASIHDYSGVNAFTQDAGNYYDAGGHIKQRVASQILSEIYDTAGGSRAYQTPAL